LLAAARIFKTFPDVALELEIKADMTPLAHDGVSILRRGAGLV
jgi:hypothetical protein